MVLDDGDEDVDNRSAANEEEFDIEEVFEADNESEFSTENVDSEIPLEIDRNADLNEEDVVGELVDIEKTISTDEEDLSDAPDAEAEDIQFQAFVNSLT